jgi:hypothetical protein
MSVDPFTMFMVSSALSAGQAGISHMAAAGQASAQNQINRLAAEETRTSLIADYEAFDAMDREETQGAAEEIEATRREAMRRRGTVRTAAGEAGVTGLSVDALLRDLHGQEATMRDGVATNLERTRSQFQRERTGAAATATRRLRSAPPVQRPSFAATALTTGAGIAGAYNTHLRVRT